MALLPSLARAGIAFLARVTPGQRKPQPPYLLDVLVDGAPKQATLPPPEKPAAPAVTTSGAGFGP